MNMIYFVFLVPVTIFLVVDSYRFSSSIILIPPTKLGFWKSVVLGFIPGSGFYLNYKIKNNKF